MRSSSSPSEGATIAAVKLRHISPSDFVNSFGPLDLLLHNSLQLNRLNASRATTELDSGGQAGDRLVVGVEDLGIDVVGSL